MVALGGGGVGWREGGWEGVGRNWKILSSGLTERTWVTYTGVPSKKSAVESGLPESEGEVYRWPFRVKIGEGGTGVESVGIVSLKF